jgi:hypothetical protein
MRCHRSCRRFINTYGTHVVVGLSMGGQDVVYVKQDTSSPLSPAEIKAHLDRLGDQLFTGACAVTPLHCKSKVIRMCTINKQKLYAKMKPLRLKMCQMPEAFNVFDAQLAQQRLQAGTTTLVSSKEVTTETPLFAWGIFTVVLSRVLILSGCDGDILQEGRQHDGEQPFGVAPHRDQRQGRSHHLPHQGRRRCRLPLSRRQPLSQM